MIPSSLKLRKAGKTRYIFRMLRTALTLFRTFCRIGACKKEFTFLLLILLTTSTRRDILKTKNRLGAIMLCFGKRCADAENKISVPKDFCHSVFCRRRIHNVCSVDTVSVSFASALSVSGMRNDPCVCFAFAMRSGKSVFL